MVAENQPPRAIICSLCSAADPPAILLKYMAQTVLTGVRKCEHCAKHAVSRKEPMIDSIYTLGLHVAESWH